MKYYADLDMTQPAKPGDTVAVIANDNHAAVAVFWDMDTRPLLAVDKSAGREGVADPSRALAPVCPR